MTKKSTTSKTAKAPKPRNPQLAAAEQVLQRFLPPQVSIVFIADEIEIEFNGADNCPCRCGKSKKD